MKVRAHVFVSGMVQGVLFRYEARIRALRNNLVGWIRNLPDGRVEAVFEGEKKAVEAMIEFCSRGPPGAIVKNFEVIWEDPTGEFKDFRIIY